jgi:hypothetical protein
VVTFKYPLLSNIDMVNKKVMSKSKAGQTKITDFIPEYKPKQTTLDEWLKFAAENKKTYIPRSSIDSSIAYTKPVNLENEEVSQTKTTKQTTLDKWLKPTEEKKEQFSQASTIKASDYSEKNLNEQGLVVQSNSDSNVHKLTFDEFEKRIMDHDNKESVIGKYTKLSLPGKSASDINEEKKEASKSGLEKIVQSTPQSKDVINNKITQSIGPYGGLETVVTGPLYKGLTSTIERIAAYDLFGLKPYVQVKDDKNYKITYTIKDAYGTNRVSRYTRASLTPWGDKTYASKQLLELVRILPSLLAKYFPQLYENIEIETNWRGNAYKFKTKDGYVKVEIKPAKDFTPTSAWILGDQLIIEGKNASPELSVAILYLLSPNQQAAQEFGKYVAQTGSNYMSKDSEILNYFVSNYAQQPQQSQQH